MKSLAPYQILFPLGVLSSVLAIAVWFFQSAGWMTTPAVFVHSRLIVGGFLWSFIAGFLMTAVPRMTGTESASRFELSLAVSIVMAQMVLSWKLEPQWFYALSIALIVFIVIYAVRRILRARKAIPVFFSHVALAMLVGVGGAYAHLSGHAFLGNHLFHTGTVLLLVLGIGTRFFSFLSGLPSEFEQAPASWRYGFHFLGLAVAVLLYLAGVGWKEAYLALTVISLIYLLFVWKVFRSSTRPSPLKYAVRIVAFMIPFSFFMCWLQPGHYVTWLHLIFIGCFAMLTYAVATRVTLAHGSYSTDLEMTSPALTVFVAFLVLSIVFRLSYGFSFSSWKTGFLFLAAAFWILAVLFWCYSFARKIIVPGDQAKPSC